MDPGSIFILIIVGVLALIGAAFLAMTVVGVDVHQGGRRRARRRPQHRRVSNEMSTRPPAGPDDRHAAPPLERDDR